MSEEEIKQDLLNFIDAQAEDVGLWFDAETPTEAYLQQELRRLHAFIEYSIKEKSEKEENLKLGNRNISNIVWISITEKLPIDGDYVLVSFNGCTGVAKYTLKYGWNGENEENPCTHWAYFPEGPEGK